MTNSRIQIKRGTLTDLNNYTDKRPGELYLAEDTAGDGEQRLYVGVSNSEYITIGNKNDYATAAQGLLAENSVQKDTLETAWGWNQSNDEYGNYAYVNSLRIVDPTDYGNFSQLGYGHILRKTADSLDYYDTDLSVGVEGLVDLDVHSRMRRCVVQDNGTVSYYLDADDSTKKAGDWLRIIETQVMVDPSNNNARSSYTGVMREIPNFKLREGLSVHNGTTDTIYYQGDRVVYGNSVWECLASSTTAVPAVGTVDADLTGADGQVMVEVPAFAVRYKFINGNTHVREIRLIPSRSSSPTSYELDPEPLKAIGFRPHPAFVKTDGSIKRAFYIGAYHASLYENVASVQDGVADLTANYAHGLSVGNTVVFYNSAENNTYPVGISPGTTYHVVNTSGVSPNITKFQVSENAYGSAIIPTGFTGNLEFTNTSAIPNSESLLKTVSGAYNTTRKVRLDFARSWARNRGADTWHVTSYYEYAAIQTLLVTEFRDMNSQRALGNGSMTGIIYNTHTGLSNGDGNASANYLVAHALPTVIPTSLEYMSYRGLENLYGRAWQWLDGLTMYNHAVYLTNDQSVFADNTSVGYSYVANVPEVSTSSYIKEISESPYVFLPSVAGNGASDNDYIADGLYTSAPGWRAANVGGNTPYNTYGSIDGAFALILHNPASTNYFSFGARLSFAIN